MGAVLQRRIGSDRTLPLGEEVLLAVSIAAGDAGAGVEKVLRSHGLTRGRYHVLRILRGAATEGLPAKEIRRRLLVSSPDLTRQVDPLVAHGWVERLPSTEDRRVWQHRLTRAGTRLLARLDSELERVYRTLVDVLGEKDSLVLVKLCERLIEAGGWER